MFFLFLTELLLCFTEEVAKFKLCILKYFVGSIEQHIMVSNFRNIRKVFENVFHSVGFPYEKGLLRFH